MDFRFLILGYDVFLFYCGGGDLSHFNSSSSSFILLPDLRGGVVWHFSQLKISCMILKVGICPSWLVMGSVIYSSVHHCLFLVIFSWTNSGYFEILDFFLSVDLDLVWVLKFDTLEKFVKWFASSKGLYYWISDLSWKMIFKPIVFLDTHNLSFNFLYVEL